MPTSDARRGGAGGCEGIEGWVGWRSQILLWMALHHCAVLCVTVLAAALTRPALERAHRVTAAVIAEGPTTEPAKQEITLDSSCNFQLDFFSQCVCLNTPQS